MLKKLIKWTLLIGPLIFLVFMAGDRFFQLKKINKILKNADGIKLIHDHEELTVHVSEKSIKETTQHTILLTPSGKKAIQEYSFTIDWDMYGGGLVAAIDLNEDGDLEIVAWGIHESEQSFYIDVAGKKIIERPYKKISPNLKLLFQKWHTINVMKGMELSILTILLFLYYSALLVIFFIRRIIKSNR